jgi:hypothetical protein
MGRPSSARMPPWVLRIEELLAPQFGRVPSHAGILGHAEEVPAGGLAQHRLGQREFAGGTRPSGPQARQGIRKGAEEFSGGHVPPTAGFPGRGWDSRFLRSMDVGIPGATRLRRYMCEPESGRRIGNPDQVLATGALDLSTREAHLAPERLVTVGTEELEFRGLHTPSEAGDPVVPL